MMEFTDFQIYSGILGGAIGFATLIISLQKITKNIKKDRDEREARILQHAKEEDSFLKAKLEARIEKIDAKLQNLELNINKDMTHMRQSYESEIRSLGEKIELLRDELNTRHSSLIELLTKIIGKK